MAVAAVVDAGTEAAVVVLLTTALEVTLTPTLDPALALLAFEPTLALVWNVNEVWLQKLFKAYLTKSIFDPE